MLMKIGITITPTENDSFRFPPIDYVEKIEIDSGSIKYSELPAIVDKVQLIARAIKEELEKQKGNFISLPKIEIKPEN